MASTDEATFTTLDDLVQHQMEQHQVPGVAVGILRDGWVETHAYGVISNATRYPTTPDTLFQIGSQTKIFTTTLVMKLVEEGKLALDTPIAEYLPDLRLADPAALDKITVRHLITHMSGLEGDRFEDTGVGDDALARYVDGAGSWAQDTAPGEYWSYCNSGWGLAARAIELIEGGVYEEIARERLFKPLGLTKTFWFPAEAVMYSLAAGHTHPPGEDKPRLTIPWGLPRAVSPAGNMISCVGDMLKWFQFHLGDGTAADGTRYLSAETLHAMQQPQTTISTTPGNEQEWGLGWQLNRIDDVRVFAHGGGTLGQISYTLGIPERNFAIAVMTNSSRGGKLIEAVDKWVLERQLELTTPKPRTIELPIEQLQRLTGVYKTTMSTSRVALVDGKLALNTTIFWPVTGEETAMPQVALVPVSEWEVMVIDEQGEEGGVVSFIPGPNDRARYFRMGRIATRVE